MIRKTDNYNKFKQLIKDTDNTYAFNAETSVQAITLIVDIIKDIGLNPMITEELKHGLFLLFNIEIINLPDLSNNRYILSPNHVSDLDAIILGLLHPKIMIISKSDWTNNTGLKSFLDLHYNLYGFDRSSLQSLRDLLMNSISYFTDNVDNKHYLIFNQGTISDINKNSVERISQIAYKVSNKTGVQIINVFMEQVSLNKPTRIIFDEPAIVSKGQDFRSFWLERVIKLQSSLLPPARLPKLTYRHSNNNSIEDPHFNHGFYS